MTITRRAVFMVMTSAWLLLSAASQLAAQEAAALETEDQKILYTLGLMVGQNVVSLGLTPEELAFVQQGFADRALQHSPKVDLAEYGHKLQAFAQARISKAAEAEKSLSAEFLAKMAAEPGAVKKDSGLIYTELVAGTGDSPLATDTVTVHYHGTLRDGTVFDSSVDRGEPATFPLNRVIPCWTEGLQLMKVGGKSRLVCPSDIAYGDQGRPPTIPGGAVLVFEVQLLGIGGAAGQPAGHP